MSVARNAPCPCGSGKRYKRCCGAPGADPLMAGLSPPPGSRWEVDLVPMPAAIENEPGARPAAALVVAGGLPLTVELVAHPPAEPAGVAAILAQAVAAAAARHGPPPAVRVRHEGVAADLARRLPWDGVTVESGPLPELDPVAADFLREVAGARRPAPTASGAPTWAAWGLPDGTVTELFQAAADYHRAAPWRAVLNQQLIHGTPPGGRGWWGCILGNGGAEFGLALYQELDDFRRQLEAPSADQAFAGFRGAMISLVFCTQAELPRRMRKEVLAGGWPVAGADAYPSLFVVNTPGGGVTAEQARDLTLMLRALPPFVARHRALLLDWGTPPSPIQWTDPATAVVLRYQGPADGDVATMGHPPERLAPGLAQGAGADPTAALSAADTIDVLSRNVAVVAAFTRALERAGAGPQTVRRHTDNATLFAGFLGGDGVPLSAVTEYDLREFLYSWIPTAAAPTRGRTDTRAMLTSLAKFFAFLERDAALSLPWSEPILADRATFARRLEAGYARPPTDRYDDRWHEMLGNDLDRRGFLPDIAMTGGGRWCDSRDMGPHEARLWRELQRRWLLWRDDAVAAGITDPADLQARLLPRQRQWEAAPHPAFGGRSPVAVVRRERAES